MSQTTLCCLRESCPPSGPQPCSICCNTNSGPGPLNTDVLFRRSRGPHPIQVSIHLSSSRIFYGGAHCSIPQSSCVTTNGYLGPQSHRHEVRGIALQALATVLELDCTGLLCLSHAACVRDRNIKSFVRNKNSPLLLIVLHRQTSC